MTPTTVLKRGRRLAAALMCDTITVTRPSAPIIDPSTGKEIFPETPVYQGAGQVSPYETGDRTVTVGAATIDVATAMLHLPYTPEGAALRNGDKVTVQSANPAIDGNTYRISGQTHATYATAHRYQMEHLTR